MADATPLPAAGERWLPVRGLEHLYEVSDQGRVRNLHGQIIKPFLNKGYPQVVLARRRPELRTAKVHTLVLEAFVGPPSEGHGCNHKNGIRHDNRLANLEWVTPKENTEHAIQTGLWHAPKGQPGIAIGQAVVNRNKTHCPAGHPYVGDNLYLAPDDRRRCRACAKRTRTRGRR